MGVRKFILLTIFVVLLGTLRETWAQKISIHTNNATLEEILKKIKKKTKFDMMYQIKDVKKIDKCQSVHFDETELQEVLAYCLQELPLDFHIYNQTIIITKKDITSIPSMRTIAGVIRDEQGSALPSATILVKGSSRGTISDKNGRFFIRIPRKENTVLITSYVGKKTCYTSVAQDSSYTITLVTDVEKVEDVIVNGYQVIAKNEMTGATTTIKGKEIRTPGANSIESAFQGMFNGLSVIIPSGNIGSSGRMKIRGTSTVVGNPEPLVVVDGIIRENAWAFDQNTLYDLLNNGTMANSARASIMGNNLTGINVDDIATITLLKDVSATAIYGIRASNGVIVITTKQGKPNKQDVSFRSDITFSPIPSYKNSNVMDASERLNLSKEIIDAGISYAQVPQNISYEGAYMDMISKKISYSEFNKRIRQLETMNTDWFKVLGGTSISHNYHLSISSGKGNLSYYASLGYRDEQNTFKNNDRQTFTGMINFNTRFSEKLKMTIYVSGYNIKTSGYYMGINPEQYALNTSRAIGSEQFYMKGKGTMLRYIENNSEKQIQKLVHFNMLHELDHTGNDNHATEIYLGSHVEWQLLPCLSVGFMPAWSQTNNKNKLWADEQSWYVALLRGANYGELESEVSKPFLQYLTPLLEGGILDHSQITHQAYTIKGQINYRNLFGKNQNHSFNATLGVEVRQNKYTGTTGLELGYDPKQKGYISHDYSSQAERFQYIQEHFPNIVPLSPNNYTLNEHNLELTDRVENVFSLYSALGYTFDSRYTFTLNLRNDASNRFGKNTNNRFYPVWSIGGRWDVHQEKWFPLTRWLNEVTLRISYGRQGNVVSNVSPHTLVSYVSKDMVTNEEYLQLQQLPNPDLKWEKTTSMNIGAELSFFENRINIIFDFYTKKVRDIVVEKSIPIENGFQRTYINNGSLDTQGYDLEVDIFPVSTPDWEWRVRFTAGYTKNILNKSNSDQQTLDHFTNGSAVIDRFPVSAFWSFPFIGLSSTNGAPLFATIDQPGGIPKKVSGSLLEYLVYSGVSEPRLSGGIQTMLRYKRISLNAIFNYQTGHHKRLNPFMSSSKDGMMAIPQSNQNASKELLDRWQQPGDEKFTNIPSLQSRDEDISSYLPDNSLTNSLYKEIYRYTLYNKSNERVVSASHIRCNRITLGYDVPFWKNKYLNISFTITNPFIIKNKRLKRQDPEVMNFNADYYTPTMSRPKNYSLSVEIHI